MPLAPREQLPTDGAARELWEPFAGLSQSLRVVVWGLFALAAILLQGPDFIGSLRPSPTKGVDFFQDWASGRNFLEQKPVYSPHQETIPLYLGLDQDVEVYIPYNAHPPIAVLCMLPFALLSYPNAVLAWNLCSLAFTGSAIVLFLRGLKLPWQPWSLLPAVTGLLLCSPLRMEIILGQFNGLLLFALTAAWYASRQHRDTIAGVLIGLAAGIKLYPGFFLLYFLLTRRYRIVLAGLGTGILLLVASVIVLGTRTYTDYIQLVLPSVAAYKGSILNVSIQGFWYKLFDPEVGRELATLVPVARQPHLAQALAVLSSLCVIGIMVVTIYRHPEGHQDHAFGLAIITMLLAAPITWDHYLLLLFLPLGVLWVDLGESQRARIGWLFAVVCAMAPPYVSMVPKTSVFSPLATVTILSVQTYLLLGLYVWELRRLRMR